MVEATLAVFVLSALVKVIALGRDLALAAYFGAGPATDAYMVATVIPFHLWLPAAGIVVLAFVPVFSSQLATDGRRRAWKTFSGVLSLLTVTAALAALAGFVWAPRLVAAMAPGLDPPTLALAASLARVMLPAMVGFSLYAVVAAALNAHGRFAVAAGAPVLLNLAMVAAILLFASRYGIVAVGVGCVVGAGLQSVFCLPSLLAVKAAYSWRVGFADPGLRKVGRLLWPLAAALLLGQASVLVERYLASWLAVGSISALAYATKVAGLPQMLVATAVATVVFPSLARYASRNEDDRFRRTLAQALRVSLLVLVPAAVGLVILGQPVVRMLLQRGAFDVRATQLTASALVFYAPGMVAAGAAGILVRGSYAVQDMISPLGVAALALVAHVAAAFSLVGPMGHAGLAIATSLGSWVHFLALYVLLRTRGLLTPLSLREWVRPAMAVAGMAVVTLAVVGLTGGGLAGTAAAIGAGSTVYLAGLVRLGVPEARDALAMARAGLRERLGVRR